jgi:hemerythrin-like metal-binding protein
MAYFSLTDDLRVGHSFIDSDHEKLIALVNQLHDAMGKGHGKEILGKILNELIHYTREHFKREEDEMKKIQYAGINEHKAEHDKLIKEVVALQAKFISGNGMLSVQVSSFLRSWLTNHIMGTDKKLAAVLKKAPAL